MEDFIERRNRQIRRSIDKNFEKYLKGPDIWSSVLPELSSEVVGVLLPGITLSPGQTLVHLPQPSPSDAFALWSGATRVIDLSGEAAAHARESGAISADVTSVEGGFAALRFHARYSPN